MEPSEPSSTKLWSHVQSEKVTLVPELSDKDVTSRPQEVFCSRLHLLCPSMYVLTFELTLLIELIKKNKHVRVQFSCFQFCFLSLPLLLQFFYCCSIVLFLARFGIKDIDLHSTVIFCHFKIIIYLKQRK